MNGRRLDPLRLALAYAGVAFLSFGVAYVVLPEVVTSEQSLVRIRAVGAGIGAFLTAVFVFLVVRSQQRALRRTDEELTEANRLLGILFRVLRHNLRNDTNVIRGYARLLLREEDDHREPLVQIDEAVSDIIDYSNKIQQMAATDPVQTTVELPRVIARTVEDVRSTYPEARITADLQGVGRVRASPDVEDALAEVIENAVLHNDTPTPEVEVELVDAGDRWRVAVRDDGPGIPEHEREVLRRGEETPHVHSSGVGLWFIHWVVTNSDGEVDIADNDPRGSVVILALPKARTGPSPTERRLNRLFRRERPGEREVEDDEDAILHRQD